MTKTNPETLRKLKHQSKKAMEQVNPATWSKIQGSAETIEEAAKTQERAMAIRKKLADHCKKHRANWVSRESVKVYEERQHRNNHPAPRPNWASPHHNVQPVMEEARRRVQQRIQNRIKQVGQIERNMQTRLAQNQEIKSRPQPVSKPSLRQDFSQSM